MTRAGDVVTTSNPKLGNPRVDHPKVSLPSNLLSLLRKGVGKVLPTLAHQTWMSCGKISTASWGLYWVDLGRSRVGTEWVLVAGFSRT